MQTYINKIVNYFNVGDERLYKPSQFYTPEKMIETVSAWKGLEKVILDIIKRFHLKRDRCLEFGVEFGYSTVVFSNYFKSVTGVDIFTGDVHTEHKGDHYEETKKALAAFKNIQLIKEDYKNWILTDTSFYDLIHVDIVHTYEDTYACGLWSAKHSNCVLFHDTESFPDVKRACIDIAKATGKKFYNYPKHYGLGIIV